MAHAVRWWRMVGLWGVFEAVGWQCPCEVDRLSFTFSNIRCGKCQVVGDGEVVAWRGCSGSRLIRIVDKLNRIAFFSIWLSTSNVQLSPINHILADKKNDEQFILLVPFRFQGQRNM